ncbi:MAG: tripartite tricarboxylate transporter TctB family protein [Pikeienuella sp.]
MRINDALVGAFLILFAIAEIAYTRTFPSLHGQSFGPDLFPIVIGVGMIICGAALIARGITTREGWVAFGDWVGDPRRRLNIVLLIAAVLAYILFSEFIGFIPLSVAILAMLIVRLGGAPALAIGVALGATLVIHTLFVKLLLVPLPWGLLLPIAW